MSIFERAFPLAEAWPVWKLYTPFLKLWIQNMSHFLLELSQVFVSQLPLLLSPAWFRDFGLLKATVMGTVAVFPKAEPFGLC